MAHFISGVINKGLCCKWKQQKTSNCFTKKGTIPKHMLQSRIQFFKMQLYMQVPNAVHAKNAGTSRLRMRTYRRASISTLSLRSGSSLLFRQRSTHKKNAHTCSYICKYLARAICFMSSWPTRPAPTIAMEMGRADSENAPWMARRALAEWTLQNMVVTWRPCMHKTITEQVIWDRDVIYDGMVHCFKWCIIKIILSEMAHSSHCFECNKLDYAAEQDYTMDIFHLCCRCVCIRICICICIRICICICVCICVCKDYATEQDYTMDIFHLCCHAASWKGYALRWCMVLIQ